MGKLGLSSILVLGALACSNGKKSPEQTLTPPPTVDFTVPGLVQGFGRKVCADLREAIPPDRLGISEPRRVIDASTGKEVEVYVDCEDHGGGSVARVDEASGMPTGLGAQHFDFPKAEKLDSPEKISAYLDGKSVVFFGENHSPELTQDAQRFIGLMPLFKEKGFDIGMEMDGDHQAAVDEYIHAPSSEAKEKLLQELTYDRKEELVSIIEAAASHGVLVYCIDNRTPGHAGDTQSCFGPRDEYMAQFLQNKVAQGSKIATFNGSYHANQGKFYQDVVNLAEFQGKCPDPENPEPSVVIQTVSAARLLMDRLGKEKVGSVDLNSCKDPYIGHCMTEKVE